VTSGEALRKYTSILKDGGIDEAADEARVLLSHVLGVSSSKMFASQEKRLSQRQVDELDSLIKQRLQRVPVAYLTGSREFYGMAFYIEPGVLIPRPETEILVEEAIKFAKGWVKRNHRGIRIVDVGTGSGIVAVVLAVSIPDADVHAIDVSEAALKVASMNVERHKLSGRIALTKSHLLQQINGPFDLVIANLPYIAQPDLQTLPPEIRNWEPTVALDGGSDGIELIRDLIVQARDKIARGGALLLEIGAGQEHVIRDFAHRVLHEAEIKVVKDLAGINRVICIVPHEKYLLQLLNTFIKYLTVGLPNAVIYFGSLYLLTTVLGVWYMLSVCIAVALQAVTSFLLHRIWTWKRRKAAIKSAITMYRFIKYMVVTVGGVLLGLALIYIITEQLHVWYMASTVISSTILQVLTFLANNYWTWSGSEGKELSRVANLLRKSRLTDVIRRLGVNVK
jgi:release factor glutamine methyltransferase